MKLLKTITLLTLIIGFTSCSNDDDDSTPTLDLESETITNIHAAQSSDYTTSPPTITGDYIKFSFETGSTTSGDHWDIAFRGSTIIVNGGEQTAEDQPERVNDAAVYIASGTLASVTDVDTSMLKQDSATNGLAITTGSGNGWYNYNPENHLITPIAGKVLVVRTHEGRYAKMEILSYYENAEPNDDLTNSQYYSFNYVYQPNEGVTSF